MSERGLFSGRRLEISLACGGLILLALAGTSIYLGERFKKISLFSEGITTCFSRVQQSYVAKVLNQGNSTYLRSSFFSDTEECFGETIGVFGQMGLVKVLKDVAVPINTLATNVHQFHESFRPGGAFSSDKNSENKTAGQFQKLENAKFSIDEQVVNLRTKTGSYFEKFKTGFIILTGLYLLGLVTFFIGKNTQRKERERIENEARKFLEEGEYTQAKDVLPWLVALLERLDFSFLSRVIEKFGFEGLGQYSPVANNGSQVEERAVDLVQSNSVYFNDGQATEEKIDKIWEESEKRERLPQFVPQENLVEEVVDTRIELSNTLAKVFDTLSSKLFSRGIMIDLDLDENLKLQIEEETLVQVLYSLVNASLPDEDCKGDRKVTIRSFQESDNIFLELVSAKVLSVDAKAFTNEMKVAVGLLNDNNAKMTVKNLKGSGQEEVGTKLEVCFNLSGNTNSKETPNKGKRLTKVTKGKKRDLVNALNA